MFVDTENKRTIRERWNLPFLSRSCERLGSKLAYFGLPGAALNDLVDWNSVLGVKTCIQIVLKPRLQREEDLEIVSQMTLNLRSANAGPYFLSTTHERDEAPYYYFLHIR